MVDFILDATGFQQATHVLNRKCVRCQYTHTAADTNVISNKFGSPYNANEPSVKTTGNFISQ